MDEKKLRVIGGKEITILIPEDEEEVKYEPLGSFADENGDEDDGDDILGFE